MEYIILKNSIINRDHYLVLLLFEIFFDKCEKKYIKQSVVKTILSGTEIMA